MRERERERERVERVEREHVRARHGNSISRVMPYNTSTQAVQQ